MREIEAFERHLSTEYKRPSWYRRGTIEFSTKSVNFLPIPSSRSYLVESPEDGSPIHPIDRRKATLRRRRRLSKRQRSLNVHIYQDSRVVQVASLSGDRRLASKEAQLPEQRSDLARYTVKSAKNLIRSGGDSSARQGDDSDDPDQDRGSNKQWERDRKFGERCLPSDSSVSKLMARSR